MSGSDIDAGDLFANLPDASANEVFDTLHSRPGVRIMRIVSHGQASAEDDWYDQAGDEWVVMLRGGAGVLIEGEAAPRELRPGDYLLLPAHCRHRVAWTSADEPTVWLAVHIEPAA